MKKLILILFATLLGSCATSISVKLANKNHQKLSDEIQIIVLEKDDVLPNNSEFIGDIKIETQVLPLTVVIIKLCQTQQIQQKVQVQILSK